MQKKVLITGSSGYIGSHFVKYFSQKNYAVFGLDRVAPPKAILKYLNDHLQTDIADHQVAEFIKRHNLKSVIHCAALALVKESVEFPEKYFDNNVHRGTTFLQQCITNGVQHFIFSSTAAVYGEPQDIPINEEHPTNPINPYGQSKREFEKHLLSHHNTGNIQAGIFRYFNACGADLDGEIGENHHPETHFIPNLINACLADQDVILFGNNYPTSDGTCVRDYIHVLDLASSHFLLLEKMHTTSVDPLYNLGTKEGYSLLQIVEAAEKIVGKHIRYHFEPPRAGDPSTLVADATKAREVLNWTPQYSDLNTIVSSALKWHQKQ
ncbi:MAG: UDP-glucose 4-epimerase GalE [Deltaproteobacteria bacterium]|nr:UDP-glucose 4-epimerase GalE [Deltaproteobacteria bacterium]